MLQLINFLCKYTSSNTQFYGLIGEFFSQNKSACNITDEQHILYDLINYRQKKTGDNVLIYAARCGNLNLIKVLNQSGHLNFNFSNNDGKNALHEVCAFFFQTLLCNLCIRFGFLLKIRPVKTHTWTVLNIWSKSEI